MKKFAQILFVFCFTLTVKYHVVAQNIGSRVELFTIENGLSQTGVNALLLDSKGFLWIGTQDGLDRFDGYTFETLRYNASDTNSICDNYIRDLCEDNNGNIWIATYNGLSCYNRKTSTFKNYSNQPTNPNSLSSNNLFSVYADKEGIIWVKTLETLEKFDVRKNKFTHYYHFNNVFNYISGDFYFDIYEDHEGRLWIGSKDGLNCFDKNFELFERFENSPENPQSISDNRIKSIVEDKEGNIWVGTDNGLNKFDRTTKTFKRFYKENTNGALLDNIINELYVDNEGQLWIGTQSGFLTFDFDNKTFKPYPFLVYGNTRLYLDGVGAILKDINNNLWMGTFQGLVKIDLKPFKFKLYRSEIAGNYNLSENNISSIYSDDNGKLLIGTWGGGLFQIDRKTGISKKYNQSNVPVLTDNSVFVIYPDETGKIWIGTGNGLFYTNKELSTFVNFSKLTNSNFLDNNRIYSLLSFNGNLWIGTDHGLYCYSPKNNTVKNFIELDENRKSRLLFSAVYSIKADKDGVLWIGTNNGLLQYIPGRPVIVYIASNPYKEGELCSNFINSILISKDNSIWLCTSSGLCKMDKSTGDVKVFNEKNGVPNSLIYSALEDNSGNLWMATNKGLVKFNPKQNKYTRYDLADGMQSYEYNLGAAFKASNGELFFGGIAGFNAFIPEDIKVNSANSDIEVTSFSIFIKNEEEHLPYSPSEVVKVPYTATMFTIKFATLDLTYPLNNYYHYSLVHKGQQPEWIDNLNKNYVTFSNLSPGEYTFSVRGSNSDQVWSSEIYTLNIEVVGPIWLTKIAWFIYIVLFLATLYFILQWRTRKLRRTNKELMDKERTSQEISRQKEELTIQNKNIKDSINYAQRIQMAILPAQRVFKKLLPSSFVYHRPKDIVSGDFYWIYERDGKIFVAAVDCTGHGVPGAFMSILGVELFRKITNSELDDPGKILSKLNEEFSQTFSDVEDISLKDGMDIAFCVIDKAKMVLEFAGAFNPLYLIRDNKIIEIKGNRFSVSMEKKVELLEFVTHTIPLQKGDMMYIFSDGYADQFGGYEGKKFKYRRFRHLLLNIHKLPLDDQKKYLDESIELWKGNNEQIDDILVIGIKAEF